MAGLALTGSAAAAGVMDEQTILLLYIYNIIYFPKIYAGTRGRGLRNGALPPRSGYETLRNGALGSGDTFLNARQ